ncbi:PREDICTED: AT-hook-containing transcription factor [Chrysochloris asiatica]|uniref:AT-hook-containing transcription factor n=1 Tax=Chrysochloris asiatica TaxID=185453 RepID=A0A9B0WPZ2_CHRAS|nr:PREDICTED: AT-hook-containing transcription factor [Chrysochloris asiatica]
MASSGTEVHWAEPGLGKGPRPRRRWAWAEEEQAAVGSGSHGWGEEGPFPSATSPELLEDFRLAQQRLPPLEWERQTSGHQDSESGESAEEEIEAEDVDSPEDSNLPLYWFPQQNYQSDMTEEEPDEALGSPQAVEEAGESSSWLGYEAGLNSEGNGSVALRQGQARSWVASDNESSGDKLPEHSEVNPSVELCSARSWSSGTMSLGHPSDILDSAWEGETRVLQPTALAETLPQSPSCRLLNPNDRTRGSVAQATLTEFRDSSPPSPHSRQCRGDGWKETTSLTHPQPRDQSWKRTRIPPKPLPSRFTGSVGPLNPQHRPAQQDRLLRQGATLAGRSSHASKYGRGRLNYPLPDFSKVGPRVRFPKDESYQPPKAKSHSWQPQGAAQPLIFKSPAEIVREVLLSSGEASSAQDSPLSHPVTRVPQEFQTPEQATKLVHQLQEDYHKLLTKYAEAENTIDQLRLGAKVNLYADPPQPSHSVHMGTVSQGTKVLSFTIPQPRTADWRPSPTSEVSEVSGWQSAQGKLSPSSPTNTPTPGWLPDNQGVPKDQPSTEQTQALASQARRFLAKVESFEDLVRSGRLTPQDQLKGFQRLKSAHAALEEEYLKAHKDQHLDQQPASSQGTSGKFDPGRELEAEIFQLGIRLEEFKDHVDQHQQEPERIGSDLALDSPPALPSPGQPMGLPSPSGHGPTPAIQPPYPEPDTTGAGPCSLHLDMELNSISSEVEGRPRELPASLGHKELQVEQDFHGLLERYVSVKSLPEALRVEEDEVEQGLVLEVDGPAPGRGETTKLIPRQVPRQAERSPSVRRKETVEQMVSVKSSGLPTSVARDGCLPGMGKAKAAPLGPGIPHPPQGTKSAASHQSSLTSLAGSGISEHLPQKSFRQAGGSHIEEPWMASPETDSGFVGSETSRVSPVTQTPEHRLSHISTPGTSAQQFTAPVPQDGASHAQARGPTGPRTAAEPSTPRSRAHRHLSSPDSPVQQRAPSFRLGRTFTAEMAVPSSEFKGRKLISEKLLPSRAVSPHPTSAPTAAALTHGPTETNSSLLLTRTGRDQAIRELQEEVSLLRLRLEDSLHRPPQGSPAHSASTSVSASTSNRPTRARDRPADSSVTWGFHSGSKSTERLSAEPGGAEQAVLTGRRRARSSSVPREVPQLSLTSESEPASPRIPSEKSRATKDSPQAARDRIRGGVTFRGHYTGQEYHVLSPKTVQKSSDTVSCPHCWPIRNQDQGTAATRDTLGPSPTDSPRCPVCHRVVLPAEGHGQDTTTSGAEKTTPRKNTPSNSSPKRRSKPAGSPLYSAPGLWYLAAAPTTPAPPAFACVSSVPILQYPPATVYYVSPGPTSAQTASEWPPAAPSRPASRHRHSIQLDLAGLEELNKALSRAVQAAKSVHITTKQMSRSLSADLRQARGLRGSCLF